MQIPPLAIENGMRTPTFEKKISDSTFLFRIFWLFLSEILSRRCRLSRTTSDPARRRAKCQPKIAIVNIYAHFYSCLSGEKIGTIFSGRSRLSRTSRAPSRLIRARLIDCDAGCDRQMKTFPADFGQLFFRTLPKKSLFFAPGIYTCDLQSTPQKKPIAGFS